MDYRGVPKSSPEYEKVDHSITIRIGNIQLGICRSTLVVVGEVAREILEEVSSPDETSSVPAAQAQPVAARDARPLRPSEAVYNRGTNAAAQEVTTLAQVRAHIQGVRLKLYRQKNIFTQFSMEDLATNLSLLSDSDLHVKGHLSSINVLDFTASKFTDPQSTLQHSESSLILESLGKHFVDFECNIVNTKDEEERREVAGHILVHAEMSSVRVFVVHKYLMALLDYATEFADLQNALTAYNSYQSSQIEGPEESSDLRAPAPKQLHLDISITNPLVAIPSSASLRQECLIFDFGKITVQTALRQPLAL